MANEPLPHLVYPRPPQSRPYTHPGSGGGAKSYVPRDEKAHATFLEAQFKAAWTKAEERSVVAQASRNGVYLEFAGAPDKLLAIQSLEDRRAGIELRNVRQEEIDGKARTFATVYVPKNKANVFVDKIRAYATERTPEKGEPLHKNLMANLDDVREALLKAFWTDEPDRMPGVAESWVELWIADDEQRTELSKAKNTLEELKIPLGMGEVLLFPERTVVLVKVNHHGLLSIIDSLDCLAEFRSNREPASFFIDLSNTEQAEWSEQLDARTEVNPESSISVCVLDTGVNRGHPLLQRILDPGDVLSVDPNWGGHDHDRHGTQMAGFAAYGDLTNILGGFGGVKVGHRLESVKIVPPKGFAHNQQHLYGFKTEQAVYTVESVNPTRTRVLCMAVTSEEIPHHGKPTSWSAAVDQLASGVDGIQKRLIVLSGGNTGIAGNRGNFPNQNFVTSIHDPSQAWNALTVGASTRIVNIRNPELQGYVPIASFGDLSPFSSTSRTWKHNRWPIKPEVLFEGGNLAADPTGTIFPAEDLMQVSLWYKFANGHFTPFGMTSGAAAQAAELAARIHLQYPKIWPETVRALMVHSADWTAEMLRRYGRAPSRSKGYEQLLRTCGYGIVDPSKAMYSRQNSLVLISEAELQPFEKPTGKPPRTKDMHLYPLPWPLDTLSEMGEAKVSMRVTLSYFVEPGPGEKGWKDRYRYPSHGLRFDVKSPTELNEDFVKRINRQARDEDEELAGSSAAEFWTIGQQRNVGSIHSDVWEGTAAELASSALIAIYPVTGWWRTRNNLGRVDSKCRYSLVVSISTEDQQIDLYTQVKNLIDIAQTVEIDNGNGV